MRTTRASMGLQVEVVAALAICYENTPLHRILMSDSLSLAIPCRADEPGLGATLTSLYTACQHPALPAGCIHELLICINGLMLGASCPAVPAAREFCAHYEIPLQERWLGEHDGDTARQPLPLSPLPIPVCKLLLTERRGKPPAWNALWRCAAGTSVLFCDADVRVDPEAVWRLWAKLQDAPELSLVAAREAPVWEGRETIWSRMAAIPYRFNFENAGGRLLLLRRNVLPEGIPENLLLEDAWLTVAVGKHRVAKEWQAKVYFLPPATGRDYFAERVRTEGGKLQIRREHGRLLAGGPIATYRWSRFFKDIAFSEYPLVLFAVLVRGVARLWARLALVNKEFYALYRPFLTTKEWPET
ncbi:MAG TPA: glycosyltransferase [Methylomirabilota bacterium]|nr:glycosyltransferase [Methylomirabilota bacterium]